MNYSSNTPEPARTHHRVFCSWPCGSFISLGADPSCEDFQQLVNLLGPPTVVEFRATDEGWVDGVDQDTFFEDYSSRTPNAPGNE